MSVGYKSLAAALVAWIAFAGTAGAQTIGLGTTQGGATGQIATAIAQVVTQNGGGLQVRPQQVATTAQYIPPINAGQLEFGIANAPQTANAFTGTGMSAGQPNPNLRLVASLFPFNAGLVATKASGMNGYADLKGKKLPWFPDNSLGDVIMRMSVEAGGLKPDDVVRVPMANFPRMFEAFKAGQIDVSIATTGSQNVIDFNQTIQGGVKFLSFAAKDAELVGNRMPGTRLRTVPVGPTNPGVEANTLVFSYDYTLFTHAGMAEDVVYRVTKTMFENAAALKATGPLWEEYDPAKLSSGIGVPFHPGAKRFYAEKGMKAD